MTYAAQTRAFVLCSSRSVTSRQSLQGSTAFPVLAILSITSSCVTVPLTITFCVSRFTSKDSTPEERRGTRARVGTKMRSSVGRSDGTSRKSADDRARGEGRAGGVARRGVAAPPGRPSPRRGERGWCGASRGRRAAGRADPTPLVPGRRRRGAVRLAGKSAGETRSHLPSSSGRAPPRRSIRRTSSPPSKRSGRSWPRRFGEAGSGGARCGSRCAAKTRADELNST